MPNEIIAEIERLVSIAQQPLPSKHNDDTIHAADPSDSFK
jgi:hypothetical protein